MMRELRCGWRHLQPHSSPVAFGFRPNCTRDAGEMLDHSRFVVVPRRLD